MKLNVVIITQGLTRIVVPICNSKHRVVGIVEDAPRNYNKETFSKLKSGIGFIYRKFRGINTLKNFAQQQIIPYFFFNKNEEPALKNWLIDKNVDVIIVYSMSKLLKPSIFNIPKYGTINLHPSYLPEYPGRNPWFWTYANTDLTPGVTLHYIDNGEDTGDIIYQERYTMVLGLESPQMQDIAIGKVGVSLFLKALDIIKEKEVLPRIKQNKKKIYPKACQIGINESIIDFNTWEVERIWHLLRGTQQWYNPIPQPKGFYKGQRWKILNFERITDKKIEDILGEIKKIGKQYILYTKNGNIYLKPTFSVINLIKYLMQKNDK